MLREIVGEQYFYPEVKGIVTQSLDTKKEGEVILIIGQPGSGKSVFMSQLYDEFQNKVECLVAIKTELLDKTDSPKDVYELFEKLKDEDKPKVLLLDSLDVLAYSQKKELLTWLFYVNKLKEIKGMTVVCASRSFEAEHLYPLNEQEWSKKISIESLPDDFIIKIFTKLQYNHNTIFPKFRDFLQIPLHLKITAEIIKNKGDPKAICTLQGLYAKLCEVLQITPTEMSLLTEIAELMIKNRTTYLYYPLVSVQFHEALKRIERPGITGIIQIDSAKQSLEFSHQTLIDFFAAWKVVNENKSLRDFVFEHNQNLFIRPVIRHILGFLRANKHRLIGELEQIFWENKTQIGFATSIESTKMHIKTAILANIASWDNPTPEEGKFLLRIFREPADSRIYLLQFFRSEPNPDWYDVLKESYILPLLNIDDPSNFEFDLILSFLVHIAKNKPNEILDVAQILLKKTVNHGVERFFRGFSDALFKIAIDETLKEQYVTTLEQAVRNNLIQWSYEIQITCKRIAEYAPERALSLFLDSIVCELQNKKGNGHRRNLMDSYYEVLEVIYKKIPNQVLLYTTTFFDQVFTADYNEKDNKLLDWPNELLYSVYPKRFGLKDFFNWYKDKTLEFCQNLIQESKQIIQKLQNSKWETQKQLSMLCKLENAADFKDDIIAYVGDILGKDLNDPKMFRQSELFIWAIEKIFAIITPQQRQELENKILGLEFEDQLQTQVWIWKPLNHIPQPVQSENIRKKLKKVQEKYNLEEYRYSPPMRSSGAQLVQSPVPADELRKMTADELFNFLLKNRNLRGHWDIEENKLMGGVEELAQETAVVLAENLEKYRNLIENLAKDESNDIYLSYLFFEMARKGVVKENIDWLINLFSSTYKRDFLQLEIIRVLREIAKNLTMAQFNQLKDIILYFAEAKNPEQDKFYEYRNHGYANDALTEGMNSARGALAEVIAFLLSRFKENYLIDILNKLSNDKTISVRATLMWCLPYTINVLGWDKCFELFSNAFQKDPDEYSETIPQFLQYVPKDKFAALLKVIDIMKEKRKDRLGVAYATIMTIYYLRGLIQDSELLKILIDVELADRGKQESFNILANQVKFEANVDKCLKIIETLLEQENVLKSRVSILFMNARPEDLEKFEPIIEKVNTKPEFRKETLYEILEYLEKCLLIDPLKAFELFENILNGLAKESEDLKEYGPASASEAPLNIINTILECYPEHEERALKLLDKLIQLNWAGVDKYLSAFDRL